MLASYLSKIPPYILAKTKTLDLGPNDNYANDEIYDLLKRTVLLGGKRLRPLLTYLMADFFGQNLDEATILARSIELVHAASLSHDDVVDNATTRRGNTSINVLSSNKKAILAGDYLLADVIIGLSKLGRPEIVSEMAQIIQDLAQGEWIQLESSERRNYSHEIIETIALKKTASVMSWCCSSPAIMMGQNEVIVNYARSFGQKLGLAFQLIDDTLDFSGQSQKDHLLDLDNGIINSVIFEWFQEHANSFSISSEVRVY